MSKLANLHLHKRDDNGHLTGTDQASNPFQHDAFRCILLNGITRGGGIDQRSGRNIRIRDIKLRWMAHGTNPSATPVAPGIFQVMIIKDKRPGTSLPTITDVFNGARATAFINADAAGRFTIVYKNTFAIGPNPSATGYAASGFVDRPYDEVYRRVNQNVRYDGDTNALDDIGDCAYYLVLVGHYDEDVTPSSAARMLEFTYDYRLEYFDL